MSVVCERPGQRRRPRLWGARTNAPHCHLDTRTLILITRCCIVEIVLRAGWNSPPAVCDLCPESASAFHWKGQQITAMVGYFAMVCWVMNVARTPGFGGSGATPLTAFPGWMCRLSHAVSIRMYRPAAYARHRWHTTVLTQPQQQLTNVNLPSPFGRASPSHGFRCNSTRDFSGPRRTA